MTGLQPTLVHQRLLTLPANEIFTTNYDDLLEQTSRQLSRPYQAIVTAEDIPYSSSHELQIVKLHGDLMRPASIVITSLDYERYIVTCRPLVRLVETAFQRKTVLFIGYSANDPNLRHILANVRIEVEPHARNLFILQFGVNEVRRRHLEKRGLHVVDLRDPENGETHDDVVVKWIDEFSQQVTDSAGPASNEHGTVAVVTDKYARTQRIISEIIDFREYCSPAASHSVIRLRQGFSSLSLGGEEYLDDLEYGALIRDEGGAFLGLLEDGYQFRVLVSQRPIFTADIYAETPSMLQKWSKWLTRCRNLIRLVRESLNGAMHLPIVVYTPQTYLNDFTLGEWSLVQGSKTDIGPSYNSTVFSRQPRQIAQFIAEFEAHMDDCLSVYARELGIQPGAPLSAERILLHTIDKLEEVETTIASRVELLQRAVGNGSPSGVP